MLLAVAMPSPRLRFAPSPSGYLHVGGARTALFSWLWARQQGGRFVLRVEDTDQERSSLDSVRAVLDAMKWLGLDWDEGPEVGGDRGPYFQSERRALYEEVCDRLVEAGHAYRCICTKEELAEKRAAAQAANPKAPFRYPGTCRESGHDKSKPHVVRFKVPASGETSFTDRVFGTVSTPNDSQYDFVLMRGDGFPIYNLACVVDDHMMGVDLVTRAKDHLGNTPAQIMIYEALGWEVPEFAHLPLMLNRKGEKLSKRHASVAVQDYRDKGYTPAGVLNYLVRFGWSLGDQEIFTLDELVKSFSWDRVGRADGKFDENKFADVAFEHLKEPRLLAVEQYAEWVIPFLAKRGISQPDPAKIRQALGAVRLRARTLVDAADAMDYYFRDPPELDAKAQAKFLIPDAAPILSELCTLLDASPQWKPEVLEERVQGWSQQAEIKMKSIAQPARVALTGRKASPGLYDVMLVLGKQRTLERLRRGVELSRGE